MKDDLIGVPRLAATPTHYLSTRPGSDSRQQGKRSGNGEGATVEATDEGRRVDAVSDALRYFDDPGLRPLDVVTFDESTKTITVPGSFADVVRHVFNQAEGLLLDKHKNYGPTNISRSPGGPLNGLRVRMHDKIARLNHMIDNGVEDAVGEALEETLMDLANYALIGVLVLRGEWPDE